MTFSFSYIQIEQGCRLFLILAVIENGSMLINIQQCNN